LREPIITGAESNVETLLRVRFPRMGLGLSGMASWH
jgi:hypothetical protein